jgi:predicted ATPase
MITRIEALGYRCLRYVSQPLSAFQVLVGPNASGKTTFLDVIAFLGRLVSDGVDAAVEERTQNFYDLVWRAEGTKFELAIEARVPEALSRRLDRREIIRYEMALSLNPRTQDRRLAAERVLLKAASPSEVGALKRFPEKLEIPRTLLESVSAKEIQTPIIRTADGQTAYYPEIDAAAVDDDLGTWVPRISRKTTRSALEYLPSDERHFPAITWLRELLTSGIQQLMLNSLLIRRASPPGQGLGFKPDGSNLPWVVAEFRQRSPERFRQWIAHLQTAFPDLQDIKTIERPEDRHRYLVLQYSEGLEVPSWMASDGTLRMLALTLPAYLEGFKGIYLIEEPENGIHPRAIETMTQSLSSVYDAQVLLATHSPVVLSTVEAEQILCFSKTPEGATDIIRGSEHPALRSWKHETTLGTLFAAGVLG